MSSITTKVLTVTELTQAIKSYIEPKFFALQLKGEITNFTQQSSGHLYFNLKDENSQISCVLFKNLASQLQKIPKAGDKVIVRASLSVYVPRGSYQLIISELQFEGLGDLLLRLHELKDKFQKKGYFDPQHKKPLPKYPKTIGVITSPTGAVIHDILTVLERRFKGFHLILNPVKVQGLGAEKEIAQAIDEFNRFNMVDVMIVGRGGGSLEDLWAFNEEVVVEAIFRSNIPVISSVGHETDFCLADFAADLRAPTPSAAAEMVIKEKSSQMDFLEKTKRHIKFHASQLLQHLKVKLTSLAKQKVFTSPEYLLKDSFQKIDDVSTQLCQLMQDNIKFKKIRLEAFDQTLKTSDPLFKLNSLKNQRKDYEKRINIAFFQKLKLLRQRIEHIKNFLESLNPESILKKGYCIPFAENSDSVIISSKEISPGATIQLQFHDGRVTTIATKDSHG